MNASLEKYERPERLDDDIKGRILVFAHESLEAARAYAVANEAEYDYFTDVEFRDGRWVSILDLRPAIIIMVEEFIKEQKNEN